MPNVNGIKLRDLVHATIAAASLLGAAHANAADVCASKVNGPAKQIYIFDGPPEDNAYQMPDGETGKNSDTYSVAAIFKNGRVVTIRCIFKNDKVVDVLLSKSTKSCKYSENKKGEAFLECK